MSRTKPRKPKKRNAKGEARARVAHAHVETNAGKLAKLEALHAVYGTYAQECIDKMVADRRLDLNGHDARTMRLYFSPTTLTSHLATCARAQAVGIVKGWAESTYTRTLKAYIVKHRDEFTDDERAQLLTIGKHMIRVGGTVGECTVEQRLVDLYWSWVWDEAVTGKRPRFGNSGMMLSQECVRHGATENADGLGGWWVEVSVLRGTGRYSRVKIPLAPHPKLDGVTKLAKTVLVRKRFDGRWTFQFTEYVDAIAKPAADAPRIAFDVGKNVLAATSDGRLFGDNFAPKLDDIRDQIGNIRANRQRQGLEFYSNSPRLATLERRLTGMMKTAAGTVVNQLIAAYPGHVFVLEDMDLSGTKGSKRFAYRLVAKLLSQRVHTMLVNPAYTSQECPSCHHVTRSNRNGTKFRCRCCGRISHADVVGARNLLGRSADKQITCATEVSDVKAILRARYHAARNGGARSSAGGRVSRRRTVRPDAHSRARPKGQQGKASNPSEG